ncbi:MAG: tRNA preQ1(34) S-adenosylmethionine ribosyltransferase-isomerase QueA [Verrucomicrobiota bacterium]
MPALKSLMRAADFDYDLPPGSIAQTPPPERQQSRLLVLDRATGTWAHRQFPDLAALLRPGDVLVLNDSRVIPARLRALNPVTGGRFEILLLEETAPNDWWAMLRPGKRARVGTRLELLAPGTAPGSPTPSGLQAMVCEVNAEGHRRLQFTGTDDVRAELDRLGEIPLPPYIDRAAGGLDRERYQTVFAREPGSVAAPTAGLHFTPGLLDTLRHAGVEVCTVTLHVGPGTFAPVKADDVSAHVMHEERYAVPAATADRLNAARREGRRIVAAGTTTLRVLETVAAAHQGGIVPGPGRTRLFIHPPHPFRAVDALLTNFHLPRSTLLMLVSAFAAPGATRGREQVLAAYREAIRAGYRFFSYGDAMFLA